MAENKFFGFFKKIAKFFRECKGEVKKISWPTVKQTTKNFGIVLLVMVVIGVFIFLLDRGLFALLGMIMDTPVGEVASDITEAVTTTIAEVTEAIATP